MLDQLLSKCTSLAHFSSVIGFVDQVANVLKGSFGGPLESEISGIVCTLIEQHLKTPISTSVAPPVDSSKPIQS